MSPGSNLPMKIQLHATVGGYRLDRPVLTVWEDDATPVDRDLARAMRALADQIERSQDYQHLVAALKRLA